jgi:hypothetical protein
MAITKIESMKENYPEFPVTNLNYAGHQKKKMSKDSLRIHGFPILTGSCMRMA